MNDLAYLLIRTPSLAGPLLWIINLIVYCIIAVILWYILQWVAQEFGVPAKIVKLLGMLVFLLLVLSLFVGCAGSGEGGRWTPADTAAALGTVERGYGIYDRYQNPAAYRPQYGTTVVIP